MNKSYIRPSIASDLFAAKGIVDAVELFPSELLDGMFCVNSDNPESTEFWLTFDDGSPAAIAYCAPEPMADGTWNLLLIAVHPDRQSEGIGSQIMSHAEEKLATEGVRVLLVETSGTDEFIRTRRFYSKLGYDEEARIREYYGVGDDKIVFHKFL
ncbi:MAG: GNAT family N-acetyltransferase [Granulosicoccus sp.]